MAEILKIIAQLAPSAGVLTDLYTVPVGRSTVISSISICNQNLGNVLIRVSLAIAGALDDSKQYLYYDLGLPQGDTFVATVGISLSATDVVRVQSDTANVSFNLSGVEIT